MKFIFNLIFWCIVVVALLPILAYAPVKTLTYIAIFYVVCIVIGITIVVYRVKHR